MIVDLPGEGKVFSGSLCILETFVFDCYLLGGGISQNSYHLGMSEEVSGVAETVGGLMIPEMMRIGPNPSLLMKGWNSESKRARTQSIYTH